MLNWKSTDRFTVRLLWQGLILSLQSLIIGGILEDITTTKQDDRLFEIKLKNSFSGPELPVRAGSYLFNPSSYQAGNTLDEYLKIKETESGRKYITGNGADRLGRLEIPVMLSKEFELVINADWREGFSETVTLVSDEVQLAVKFWADPWGHYINFAPNTSHVGGWHYGTSINNMRLSVKGTVAKLEINGRTHSKVALSRNDIEFTKLIIGGIQEDTGTTKQDDRLFEVMVKSSTLISQFSANPTAVSAGNSVKFTDQSAGSPAQWAWTFPGGNPSSSSEQNPTVTYNTAGKYDVTLTVSNASGSDIETKTGCITVTASSSSSCNFDVGNDCKISLEEAIYALQVVAGIRSGSSVQHQIPYILKKNCVFTVYTESGVSVVSSNATGGTSTSTIQNGDMRIVIQNCVITENTLNIPVYEE